MVSSYTPNYKIINKDSGADITAKLRKFIVKITIKESSASANDTLSISIDAAGIDVFPISGTKIECHLGYKETGLINFGVYKVDTKSISGPPEIITVICGASDFNASYKSQKSRHWDDKTLGDILSTVAETNDLALVIDDELAEIQVKYMVQKQESDMNFIARLATEYAANGTIKAGHIYFKKGNGVYKTVDRPKNGLVSYNLKWIDKPKYDYVVATWQDINSSTSNEEIYDGEGFSLEYSGSVARVKEISQSQYEARKNAKAFWHKLEKLKLSGTMNIKGDPNIVSGLGFKLSGFGDSFDGHVVEVKSTTHIWQRNGYTTNAEISPGD